MGYPESYYLKAYCKWFFGKCQCTVTNSYEILEVPVDVRVPPASKLDPQGRAFEAKYPPEIGFEIATVALGHGPEGGPVHYDDRRIASALMRVAQLGP